MRNKIKVGMWTELPNGKFQKDTPSIIEMLSELSGIEIEPFLQGRTDSDYLWEQLIITEKYIRVRHHDGTYNNELLSGTTNFVEYTDLQKLLREYNTITDLRGTKIDLRREDGSVDEELSRAFQEACYEQGIGWSGVSEKIYKPNVPFLYIELDGYLWSDTWGHLGEQVFHSCGNKEISFTYKRTLEWEAKEKVVDKTDPDNPEITTLFGEEYDTEKLKKILDIWKMFGLVDDEERK